MIRIRPKNLADMIWGYLREQHRVPLERLEAAAIDNDEKRAQADYDTGSISMESMIDLYLLVAHFKFDVIGEVGTFIGNSTCAMALAGHGSITTCDMSNDLDIQFPFNQSVIQFKKQSSDTMFKAQTKPFDFLYLDGRLNSPEYLRELLTPNTIVGFDDYEGIKKGVSNMMLVHSLLPNHWIAHSPGKMALLIPPNVFAYARQ